MRRQLHRRYGIETFKAKCSIYSDSLDALGRIEHLDPDCDEARKMRHLHETVTQQMLAACARVGREGFAG